MLYGEHLNLHRQCKDEVAASKLLTFEAPTAPAVQKAAAKCAEAIRNKQPEVMHLVDNLGTTMKNRTTTTTKQTQKQKTN